MLEFSRSCSSIVDYDREGLVIEMTEQCMIDH